MGRTKPTEALSKRIFWAEQIRLNFKHDPEFQRDVRNLAELTNRQVKKTLTPPLHSILSRSDSLNRSIYLLVPQNSFAFVRAGDPKLFSL